MKIAVIQLNTDAEKSVNLESASRLIRSVVAAEKPELIILPEFFICMTGNPAGQQASAESVPDGPTCRAMSALARELSVAIHAGTIIERNGDRFHNTAVAFGADGEVLAIYRKIHMFDVNVPGGMRIMESEMVSAGDQIVTYQLGGLTIGCAICYDLRFPELFRALRDAGADVIVLPSAFTLQTGKDHWEPLIRARAIETQVYLAASAQAGSHANGKKTCWGHSMIVDPWGCVISQASDGLGWAVGTVDRNYLQRTRRNLPVHQHHILT